MSTAISALRNELGTAKDIEASGTEIVYYNSARGSTSKITAGTSDIMITRYLSSEELGNIGTSDVELISSEDSTKDLHVKFIGVAYDKTKGVITFTDLTVNRKDTSLLKRNVSIRVISQEKITE
jgi:hypothetical protein